MIAVIGLRLGLLTPAMYSIIVLIAILTPLMAPPVLRFAMGRMEGAGRGHPAPVLPDITSGEARSEVPAPTPGVGLDSRIHR